MVAETTCPVRKRTEVVSEQANQDGTGTVKTVHDLLEDDEANEHRGSFGGSEAVPDWLKQELNDSEENNNHPRSPSIIGETF